jgi:hypothetical protein
VAVANKVCDAAKTKLRRKTRMAISVEG